MKSEKETQGHFFPVTVFYEDTDAAGVVYHANYIKFMERARTIFLQSKGLSLKHVLEDFKIQFLVRSVSVKFEKPVKLEQNLTVVTKITKLGKASLVFSQNLYFNPLDSATVVCIGEVVVVCTDLKFKPCSIPDEILRELKV